MHGGEARTFGERESRANCGWTLVAGRSRPFGLLCCHRVERNRPLDLNR
jgi:hypothetical protein